METSGVTHGRLKWSSLVSGERGVNGAPENVHWHPVGDGPGVGHSGQVSKVAGIEASIYFKQAALHSGLSHKWEPWFFFQRRVIAFQGVVDHCAPPVIWAMGALYQ